MKPFAKSILIVILGIGMVVPLSSETVLLYSTFPEGKGDVVHSTGYLEDGIMDVFFQAGHIIFNGGYSEESESDEANQLYSEAASLRMAKRGGASLLLEIQLRFSDEREESIPVAAKYSFTEVSSERQLSEGEVLIKEVEDASSLDSEELIAKMGRLLGERALKGL